MKNKILLISAVGFMIIISTSAFSQTVAPANQASTGNQSLPATKTKLGHPFPSSSPKTQSPQTVHVTTSANQSLPTATKTKLGHPSPSSTPKMQSPQTVHAVSANQSLNATAAKKTTKLGHPYPSAAAKQPVQPVSTQK